MTIDINDCDLNNDYFHFTNKANVNSILNSGLIPSIGAASKLVEDRANVSVSKGGKGIMGIINSFIYKCTCLKVSEIPEEYKKYFLEILDTEPDTLITKEEACKAMIRKLKSECNENNKVAGKIAFMLASIYVTLILIVHFTQCTTVMNETLNS